MLFLKNLWINWYSNRLICRDMCHLRREMEIEFIYKIANLTSLSHEPLRDMLTIDVQMTIVKLQMVLIVWSKILGKNAQRFKETRILNNKKVWNNNRVNKQDDIKLFFLSFLFIIYIWIFCLEFIYLFIININDIHLSLDCKDDYWI